MKILNGIVLFFGYSVMVYLIIGTLSASFHGFMSRQINKYKIFGLGNRYKAYFRRFAWFRFYLKIATWLNKH